MDNPDSSITGRMSKEQAANQQVLSLSQPPGSHTPTSTRDFSSAASTDREEPTVKRPRHSSSASPNKEACKSSHPQMTVDKAAPCSGAKADGIDGSSSSSMHPFVTDASHYSVSVKNMQCPQLSLDDYMTENFEHRVQQLPRQWETTELGAACQAEGVVMATQGNSRCPMTFTLMTYNILAQDLINFNPDLYTLSRPESLAWEQRRCRLMAEIAYHNADILSLQEVQEDHYFNYLKPRLEQLGYSGCYQKRTGDKTDGCATLWKTAKFDLLQSTPVQYCRGGLLDRDNVAILLQLQPKRPGREVQESAYKPEDKVLIANTHLLFNPRRGDIKLAQLMILLAEIDKHACLGPPPEEQPSPTASSWDDRMGKERYCPVILTGDFNMEPHCDLYKFLVSGVLQYEGLLVKEMSGQYDSGWYGGTYYLQRHFLSPMYGVTDLSQYHSVVVERLQQSYQSYNNPPASLEGEGSVGGGESNQKNSGQCQGQGKDLPLQRDGENSQEHDDSVHKADGPTEAEVNSDMATAENSHSCLAHGETETSLDTRERGSERKGRSSDRKDRSSDRKDRTSDSKDRRSDSKEMRSDLNERSSDSKERSWNMQERSSERRPVWHNKDSNVPPLTPGSSGCLSHHLNLLSAYGHKVQRLKDEDEVTTHHSRAECTVDYVFYSVDYKDVCVGEEEVEVRVVEEGHLKLLGRYGLMSGSELDRLGGIPNSLLPSDHLCLVTKFLLQ